MAIQDHAKFFQLTAKIWPESIQMDENRRDKAVETIVQLVYLAPFTLAGLIWLIVETNYGFLAENLDRLLILFAAMTLLLLQPFKVRIGNEQRGGVFEVSGSLAPLVMWSALFISGAAGLWAMVLAVVVTAGWRSLQLDRYGENPLWEPLAQTAQQIGSYVLATIVLAVIYIEIGGVFPMESAESSDWVPAIAAIIGAALLSGLIMLPAGIQLDLLQGKGFRLGRALRFYLGYIALPLVMGPFAIIVALLSAEGRTMALAVMLLGLWLVNRMAHHLSKANDRSRQQAREFAMLEQLGEALIEAPADGSTLSEVLATFMPKMFPVDRVEIKLFNPEEKTVWSPFNLHLPDDAQPVDGAMWDQLSRSKTSYIVKKDIRLAGERRVFGDGLAAKIFLERPEDETEARLIGGIYLLRHRSVGSSSDSLAAVQSLASQIGSAIYRAEAHAELMAYHKTQQELEFAGRVQKSFLPATVPDPQGWQIEATLVPARQTSGDFYDFIQLTDELLGIIVADVSDKGTGAALYMALSRTLIRTYAVESETRPEEALTRANERIFTDTETDQFVTLIYGILNTTTGEFVYCNAGHNPGYLLRASQGEGQSMAVDRMGNTGIPLGMFEGMEWKQASVAMESGDVLLLYSDGVPEAEDAGKNEYGDDRFLEVAKTNARRPAAEIQGAVIEDIREFVGDAPQFDDITLVVVMREVG